MQIDTSIAVQRPAEDVIGFVADVRNDPRWHTDVLVATASSDAVAVGTVFNVKVKPSMGVSEGTMTVTRLEPNLVEFDGRMGKMAPTVRMTAAAEGGGSRLTRTVELEPPGAMRLMSPVIKRMIAKDNERFLANLKRVLEQQQG